MTNGWRPWSYIHEVLCRDTRGISKTQESCLFLTHWVWAQLYFVLGSQLHTGRAMQNHHRNLGLAWPLECAYNTFWKAADRLCQLYAQVIQKTRPKEGLTHLKGRIIQSENVVRVGEQRQATACFLIWDTHSCLFFGALVRFSSVESYEYQRYTGPGNKSQEQRWLRYNPCL